MIFLFNTYNKIIERKKTSISKQQHQTNKQTKMATTSTSKSSYHNSNTKTPSNNNNNNNSNSNHNVNVKLYPITKPNIGILRQLNTAVLSASYSDAWYRETLKIGPLGRIAYYFYDNNDNDNDNKNNDDDNDNNNIQLPSKDKAIPIGAVRAALDIPKSLSLSLSSLSTTISNNNNIEPPLPRIYIMTIAVLAPFRNMGIGTLLLDHIIKHARELEITQIYLHVHTQSIDAINWYLKHGFRKLSNDPILGYYRKMSPPGDAYILGLDLI